MTHLTTLTVVLSKSISPPPNLETLERSRREQVRAMPTVRPVPLVIAEEADSDDDERRDPPGGGGRGRRH